MSCVTEFAQKLHYEIKKIGGDGSAVVTIEMNQREAHAFCYALSAELSKLDVRAPRYIMNTGEVVKYHGVTLRIVEKA